MGNSKNKEAGIAHILILVLILGLLAFIVYFFTSGSLSNFLSNHQINQKSVFASQTHPFLIVKQSEYPDLQAKASQEPWASMKTEALRIFNTFSYSTQVTTYQKGNMMRDIMGAAALLYIIDPANQPQYKAKIVEMLNEWPALFNQMQSEYPTSTNRWLQIVPPSSGFFNSVLALDVIHDDLTPEELATYEASLDAVAEWYYNVIYWWPVSNYSVQALWAQYQGDTARLDTAKANYRNYILTWFMSTDGVSLDGPEYTDGRFGGDRTGKIGWMHVAEYTGVDPIYYSDSRFKNLFEYEYIAGAAPTRDYVTFGDSGHNGSIPWGIYSSKPYAPPTSLYTAGRFSQTAAQAAARIVALTNSKPGDLITYTVTKDPLPAPQANKSRVWADGGAAFWENSLSTDALMGALFNVTKVSEGAGHRHKDINAIYLAGYGEALLLNSGYNGAGNGALGYSWAYIHDTAVSSNTVLVNGQDHVSKIGDKISESLLSSYFDYASGLADTPFSGAAKQDRNFFLVHPQDNKNGYFITIDEVTTGGTAGTVQTTFHPASANVATTSANLEYQWIIKNHKATDTYLSIFLGTAPSSVEVRDGVLAGWNKSFIGKYLYSSYNIDAVGKKNVVTVLFPHDNTHPKAVISRINGAGYTGASVNHSDGIVDYALESAGTGTITHDGVSWQGLSSLYRLNNTNNSFYFVRKGLSFNDGKTPRKGFLSDAQVSIYMKDMNGTITSSGTDVTFYYPGVTGVKIDGATITPISYGVSSVKVAIPSGNHQIELTFDPINDTILPTVSITSPVNGSTVSQNKSVNIAASASDNIGIDRVEFYVDNVLKCTDISVSYNCTWTVPQGRKIKYILTAKAYDLTGNSTISAIVQVTSR